jgi:hypothetical protein
VLGAEVWASFCGALRRGVARLQGHTVWNVNTTAAGGGVAEMLHSSVGYSRGAGVDVRWAVITPPSGMGEFFAVTKRIHNMLHGYPGDGLGLDRTAREVYRAALEPNAVELAAMAQPGDVVILHDPQTAGLVPAMRAAGLSVIWRCHIGTDEPNAEAHEVWDFLRPFVEQADRYVFSRPAHVWEHLDPARTWIVPPSIDAFSSKNQDLPGNQVEAILLRARPTCKMDSTRCGCPRSPARTYLPNWRKRMSHAVCRLSRMPSVSGPRRAPMKTTTIRFGPDLWRVLESEAATAGVPVSQYIRDAALARALATAAARGDGPLELLAGAVREAMRHHASVSKRLDAERHLAALARLTADDRVADSVALAAQSHQAHRKSKALAEHLDPPSTELE